jgi:branched-chain amino acid transport system permease protein
MKDLRYTRFLGFISGLTMAFTGAIGMIEVFNQRTIIDPFLTMGTLMLLGIPAVIGVVAAKGRSNPLEGPTRDPLRGALAGLIMGLIAGVFASLFVLLVDTVDLTEFFPNLRPAMVDAMTFGFGVPVGLAVLSAASGLAGAAGGFFSGMSADIRRGMGAALAWVLGFSLLQGVVADIVEVRTVIRAIYSPQGGLQWWAALIIGALAWWLTLRYQGTGKKFAKRVREADPKSSLRRSLIGLAILMAVFLPMLLGGILNELLINVSFFILMGLGLNIVVGYAGLLDLGYVAFFAVGAYGTAVLTSPLSSTVNPEMSWWLALLVVIGLAAIAGILVGTPVLRMRGDYLAIVTLGFGEMVRILLLSDWLTPIFGGAQGIRRIPGIPIPFTDITISGVDPQLFIYFTLFFVLIATYVSYRASTARVGRAWAAMREDEEVAEATGVSTVTAKLLAFVTGAIIASFAGALFSAKVGAVFTNSFDLLVSIVVLLVVILGGMGSIPGIYVGSLVLIGLLGGPKSPGLLAEFGAYKLLFYGAILVFMMLKRPEGLWPSKLRSRELHIGELSQDAWLEKKGEFSSAGGEEATV